MLALLEAPAPELSEPALSSETIDPFEGFDWAELAVGRLAQGIAVMQVDGRLRYLNAAAQEALGRVGWAVQDDQLQCPSSTQWRAWRNALRQSCLHGQHLLISIASHDGAATLMVSLRPLKVGPQCFAVVNFEREALCGAVELQMFSGLHELTPTEALVLQRLVAGLRPQAIAGAHGVSLNTVLAQIAAIRAKTGHDSVLELLAHLSKMPALRPAGFSNTKS